MIVDTAVHALLTGIREALAIWLALVALAAVACAFLSAPARRGRARKSRPVTPVRSRRAGSGPPSRSSRARPDWTVMNSGTLSRKGSGPNRAGRVDASGSREGQAEELRRYAEEVAVAATRAADAAERWRSEWLAVQKAKDAAWRAYETADEAARRAYRASAFPTPQEPLTPDELAARERYLHRAAREAYRAGELSLSQLGDALSHRNGWNPRLHPFEQQLILRRTGLERKLQAYRTVSAMERSAWEAAEVAEVAKHSLRREAFAAQQRAREANRRVAKAPVTQLYVPSPRPSLATR
ncbi:MAG: hypothetical protein V7603_5378 [Micromonosporaceae bacterium]